MRAYPYREIDTDKKAIREYSPLWSWKTKQWTKDTLFFFIRRKFIETRWFL